MSRLQVTASEAAKRTGLSLGKIRDLVKRLCIEPSGLENTNRCPIHKYWYSDIVKLKKYDCERMKQFKKKSRENTNG